MIGKADDLYKVYQFFTKKVSANQIKDFCMKNGFYIHIYDGGYIELRRYKDGSQEIF